MEPAQLITAALVGNPAPELLDDAARHATARRATVRTRRLEKPTPAPEQEPNQAPQAFATALGAVLARPPASCGPLLVEALLLLSKHAKVLPTRLLVPLLDAARRSSDVATALQPVLGARGRWLAGLNNDWLRGRAVAEPKAADWDEGNTAERVAWLRHVRGTDPDAGRALVVESRKEKAADRAQFVEALEIGLGAGDEAFLETLLNGRSKEVARAAARLLVRLDGSAYQRRALDLAQSCLTLTETPASGLLAKLSGKSTRTITAVAPPAEDMEREFYADSVQFNTAKGPVGRIQTLVAVIPPSRWAEVGLPLDLLAHDTFLDGELVDLQAALAVAVQRTRDIASAQALNMHVTAPAIALLLPPVERDEHLIRVIRATRSAEPKALGVLCEQLADIDGLRIPLEAANLILDIVEECLSKKMPIPDVPLELVAAAADPKAAPTLIDRITRIAQDTTVSTRLKSQARAATMTLTLRRSIYQSLQPKEPR